jgi:hypothetical protein
VSERIRSFLRYNIVSIVAVFLAFSAPVSALIINGTLVADESLTGVDIRNESLTGADVFNDSLTGADIDESTLLLPSAKLAGRQVVQAQQGLNAGICCGEVEASVSCPPGKQSTSGGFAASTNTFGAPSAPTPVEVIFDRPSGTGWSVRVRFDDFVFSFGAHLLTVYAVCVDASS